MTQKKLIHNIEDNYKNGRCVQNIHIANPHFRIQIKLLFRLDPNLFHISISFIKSRS